MGLERQLNAVIGYVRFVLSSEQKKADFRPDSQQIILGASAVSHCSISTIYAVFYSLHYNSIFRISSLANKWCVSLVDRRRPWKEGVTAAT